MGQCGVSRRNSCQVGDSLLKLALLWLLYNDNELPQRISSSYFSEVVSCLKKRKCQSSSAITHFFCCHYFICKVFLQITTVFHIFCTFDVKVKESSFCSGQASLSCRVQQLLLATFPEVEVPAVEAEEEEVVNLSVLLNARQLPESEEEEEKPEVGPTSPW